MSGPGEVIGEFTYCRVDFVIERVNGGLQVWCKDSSLPAHLVCTIPKGSVEAEWTEAWERDEIRPLILQRAITAAAKHR